MSLAENLARKRYTAVELAREISALKDRGYDYHEIACKTDLDVNYRATLHNGVFVTVKKAADASTADVTITTRKRAPRTGGRRPEVRAGDEGNGSGRRQHPHLRQNASRGGAMASH